MAGKSDLKVFVLLFALVLAAYAPAVRGAFVFDDRSLVVENADLRRLSTVPDLFFRNVHRFSPMQKTPYYRPLQGLTYALDHALWGDRSVGYHLANLVWHAATAFLVWKLLLALAFAPAAALLAALFFALHPVHLSSAAYIAGRADMLVTFFILAGCLAFVRHVKGGDRKAAPWALAALAAALLSRENALLGPFAFALAGWAAGVRPGRILRGLAGPFLLAAAYVGLRAHFWGAASLALPKPLHPTLPNVLSVLRHYAELAVFPWPLYPMHATPWVERVSASDALFAASAALLAFACFRIDRRNGKRTLTFAVLWTALFFEPLGGLVHGFPRIGALMAESWFYQPAIGVAALAACAFARFGRKGIAAGAALAAALGTGLFVSAGVWKDEVTLYRHALRWAPQNPNVRLNLANAYHERGDEAAAAALAEETVRREPNEWDAYLLLGNVRFAQGDRKAAEAAYERAAALRPEAARAWANLGALRRAEGRDAEALAALKKAVALDPSIGLAWHALGAMALHRGDFAAAADAYRRALDLSDDAAAETGYGIALGSLGRPRESESAFRRALKLDPKSVEAMKNLGVTLANEGRIKEAREWWAKARAIAPDDADLARYAAEDGTVTRA